MKNYRYFTLFLFLISVSLSAQDQVVGKWKTIDDNSGEARSVVEIYKNGTEYFGKITKIYFKPGDDTDPICDLCKGDRKNKKVIGMEIIRGLSFDKKSKEYGDGKILDPENGSIYDCKIWIDGDGSLRVRGYLYFFFRTQTWLPFDE